MIANRRQKTAESPWNREAPPTFSMRPPQSSGHARDCRRGSVLPWTWLPTAIGATARPPENTGERIRLASQARTCSVGPAKVAVLCWLLAGCCLGPVPSSRAAIVGVGDLAFVGYNSDGDDDFALVLLADAEAGTVIRFSDKEWQGTAFNTGEGGATWTATSPISAGTVVSFSDVDNVSNPGFGASSGTLSNALQFATGAETLYAFLGSDINTPVTFLAAISNSAGDYNGAQGTLAGTGLTLGTTAVLLPSGTRGGKYTGPRTGATNLAGYLPQIGNVASQWTTNTSNGELLVPFSLETFTTVLPPAPGPTPQVVAEPNSSISWAGVGAIAFVLQCLRRQRRCTVLPHRVATR